MPATALGPPAYTPDPPPAAAEPADTAPACPTCAAPRPGRFCPECGERRVDPDDYRLRHFAAHAVDQIFNLDGTFWRTLRALLTRPGLLTAEYLAGRRTRYTRPLQLFLLVNVAFFLALGPSGSFRFRLAQYARGDVGTYVFRDTARVRALVAAKAARERVPVADVERRFDAASATQQSVWLLTAPLFAGVLAALYARRRLPYVRHLVFAAHFFAFLLLVTGATVVLLYGALVGAAWATRTLHPVAPAAAHAIAAAARAVDGNERWTGPLLVWVAVYLVLALRRAYAEPWGWAVVRAAVLAALIGPFFSVYRDLLFLVTYLSI